MLVSQGVISRNYDDSQYDVDSWFDYEEELRVAHLTTYTRLALSRSLCDSYASASFPALGLFTALGFCVIHSLPTLKDHQIFYKICENISKLCDVPDFLFEE
jgi:hypothetical protein